MPLGEAAPYRYPPPFNPPQDPIEQWLFRKTRTMGTVASQAEIGVWVQAPGRFCVGPENFEIVCAKSCNLVHFWPENGSQCCP